MSLGLLTLTNLVLGLVAVWFVYRAMRPRRIYIVRHGQTLLNAQGIRQGADGALSEKGRAQAAHTAAFFLTHPVMRIISSSFERAQETALIIAKTIHAPIVLSPLLVERRNPSQVIGKSLDDPEVQRITDHIDLGYHDDDYRYADEENFADLKKRAHQCLSMLSRQGSGDVLVVTHHHFLKMLLAYMLYRNDLHADAFIKLSFFNYSNNARVSICEYHPWLLFSKTRGWRVIAFDQAV